MATPRFIAKKVGDRFELVRQDSGAKANDAVLTAAGGLLALLGLSRRGLTGLAVTALGAGMLYRGVTGRMPLKNLLCADCPEGSASETPSFQNDFRGKASQVPADEVDEASMESFPASDPPSHRSKQPA